MRAMRAPSAAWMTAALLAAPLLSVSCKKKEEPAPVAQQQPTATTAPTTTLPPPTPTAIPTPPPVWRDARWGMTRKEVLAAFPKEARKLDQPADFAQPQPGSSLSTGSSDVAIPAYEAYGTTFRVLFGFAGDALDRVHLAAAKPSAATCGDVEKAISESQTAPPQRAKTGSSLKGEEVTWRLPDQTIVLNCSGVPSLGFVNVTLDHLKPAAAN